MERLKRPGVFLPLSPAKDPKGQSDADEHREAKKTVDKQGRDRFIVNSFDDDDGGVVSIYHSHETENRGGNPAFLVNRGYRESGQDQRSQGHHRDKRDYWKERKHWTSWERGRNQDINPSLNETYFKVNNYVSHNVT